MKQTYFEHLFGYYQLPYAGGEPAEPYPHLDGDYGLLAHVTIDIDGHGFLIFWSEAELDDRTQNLLEHELVPDGVLFNTTRYRSFTDFQAWYQQANEQDRQQYWLASATAAIAEEKPDLS